MCLLKYIFWPLDPRIIPLFRCLEKIFLDSYSADCTDEGVVLEVMWEYVDR